MTTINAQDWLKTTFPENNNKSRIDEYRGEERQKIEELDISSGGKLKKHFQKGRFRPWSEDKRLKGSLKLVGFTKLKILKVSSHELISLDVGECSELEELECDNNKITFLNVKGLKKLRKISCFENKINELDLSDNIRLEELIFPNNQIGIINLSNNTGLKVLRCHRNTSLKEVTGLKKLRELITVESNPFKPINQLRNEVDKVFLTGINKDGVDYPIGYYSNQRGNNLIDREVSACEGVRDTLSKDILQKQRGQARQEIEAYEVKIEQVKPWLQ